MPQLGLPVVSLQNEVDSQQSRFAASCSDGAEIDLLYKTVQKTHKINYKRIIQTS